MRSAHSPCVNTSLCVGKGAFMVFVCAHCLCIWSLSTKEAENSWGKNTWRLLKMIYFIHSVISWYKKQNWRTEWIAEILRWLYVMLWEDSSYIGGKRHRRTRHKVEQYFHRGRRRWWRSKSTSQSTNWTAATTRLSARWAYILQDFWRVQSHLWVSVRVTNRTSD